LRGERITAAASAAATAGTTAAHTNRGSVTPWLSYHILKSQYVKVEKPFVLEQSATYRIYCRIIAPFLERRSLAWTRKLQPRVDKL